MKNIAIKALDPVLNKINALANNQQVQEMFNMFINGASLAAQAILNLIEGISWLLSVLEPVAPVILGLVGDVNKIFIFYSFPFLFANALQRSINLFA